jgi:hypothetical protein
VIERDHRAIPHILSAAGNVPIIFTSSAPPPIEVSSGKPGFAYRTRKLDPDYSTSGFLVR